jgi:hypothetical protein
MAPVVSNAAEFPLGGGAGRLAAPGTGRLAKAGQRWRRECSLEALAR